MTNTDYLKKLLERGKHNWGFMGEEERLQAMLKVAVEGLEKEDKIEPFDVGSYVSFYQKRRNIVQQTLTQLNDMAKGLTTKEEGER